MPKKDYKTRFEERFRVTPGCWLWLWGKSSKGYGAFYMNGRSWGAHCVAYRLYKGPIPEGMLVMHTCDNPGCVNPDHLEAGTDLDNVRDMNRKGRAVNPRGEHCGAAKLKKSEVLEIRDLLKAGLFTQTQLGQMYNVVQQTITHINLNRNWRT